MELLRSAGHPEEIAALVNYKLGKCSAVKPKCKQVRLKVKVKIKVDSESESDSTFNFKFKSRLDSCLELRPSLQLTQPSLRAESTFKSQVSQSVNVSSTQVDWFDDNHFIDLS